MSNGDGMRVRNRGLRRVRVRDIVDNPLNFRTHGQDQRDGLANTVREIGWYGYPDVFEHPDHPGKVMLVDGELRTHHLLERYGPDFEIEVNETDFSPTEAAKALATHDPISAMAGMDTARHAALMHELSSAEASQSFRDFLADLAKRQTADAQALLASQATEIDEPEPGLCDPDAVPDAPDAGEPAFTQPGDLWILGTHRLLCGDSRLATDVARLLQGSHADMLLTDPPYGVSYVGKTKDALTVENDALDEGALTQLIADAFDLAQANCRPGAYWYATVPAGPLAIVFEGDWKRRKILRQIMVWAKDSMVLGHSEYHYQHEPILFGWIPGGQRHRNEDRTRTTLWQFARPKASREHPTMKPIALWERAVGDGSRRGELIYDPFLGSGTTIIAAEQLGRRCAGLELNPQYCDVIVERYQRFTGRPAVLERGGERRTVSQADLRQPAHGRLVEIPEQSFGDAVDVPWDHASAARVSELQQASQHVARWPDQRTEREDPLASPPINPFSDATDDAGNDPHPFGEDGGSVGGDMPTWGG